LLSAAEALCGTASLAATFRECSRLMLQAGTDAPAVHADHTGAAEQAGVTRIPCYGSGLSAALDPCPSAERMQRIMRSKGESCKVLFCLPATD
jgi:hypothetical protein